MYICEISIIIILICRKLKLVRPIQQKFELPFPYKGKWKKKTKRMTKKNAKTQDAY